MKKSLTAFLAIILLLASLSSCSDAKDAAMSLKGQSISKGMYNYWLSDCKDMFLSNYSASGDSDEFWDQTVTSDGGTAADFVTDYTDDRVKNYLVALSLFDEYKLSLGDGTIEAIDEDIADKQQYHGSQSALNESLSEFGINKDILREIYIIEAKYDAVYDYLYGGDGVEAVGSEEVNEYYLENYIRFKYIIIYTGEAVVTDDTGGYTYDENGNIATRELTEAEKTEKQSKVNSIIASLSAGGDFEALMTENSEVNMTDSFPNGITINPSNYDTFGADFVLALMEIEPGGFTSVADESVTYILKRYDLTGLTAMTEDELEQISDIESYCINKKANEKFSSYYGDIKTNDGITASFDIREVSQNSYF